MPREMPPIISVTTPRSDSGLLVSLDDLKAELQITTADNDTYLSALLLRVSGMIESYCGRVFPVETILETHRFDPCIVSFRSPLRGSIQLFRDPIVSIESVIADGTTLDPADYAVSAESDELFRLSSDVESWWGESKIDISYVAGYASTPGPVQQQVFELIKLNQAARSRDPSLRSENILGGLYSYTLFGPGDYVRGMPTLVAAALDQFSRAARA